MTKSSLSLSAAALGALISGQIAIAGSDRAAVPDAVIEQQRAALAASTEGAGYGPQSPRDLATLSGENDRAFGAAPAHTQMNLCNIHFHESAEHRGGAFTAYRGNGDGRGNGTGFLYAGTLSEAELAPLAAPIGEGAHGDLVPGDTIEIHFVYSSAEVTPGPTLGACVSDAIMNPQLRVEGVVAVLVNDPEAADFTEMAALAMVDGLHQVPNLPDDLGEPVVYAGSTTGPAYNEKGSPFQVTWSVRTEVVKLDIASVGRWLSDNPFEEREAHGVRNLVVNPALLAPIGD